jgi:hypothetical protein
MNALDHTKRTNGVGIEVHKFIDQYYPMFRGDHRVLLHHKKGIKLIGEILGEYAIPIAEQHIRDDWDGKIPEDYNDKNYYREAWCFDIDMFNEAIKFAKEILYNEA